MEIYLYQIGGYLIRVFHESLNQLFTLFGPFLILIVFLNLSASVMARLSVRLLGRNLFLYGFAWLGCSVHELSHAFFALVFGHKIKEITLFEPNKDGESMGHVSHSYNKKSFYQKIGNFFIGIGPILAGGIVLFLITLILYKLNITDIFKFRFATDIFTSRQLLGQLYDSLRTGMLTYINLLFAGKAVIWWKSFLFIYVLYSIGSSMTLSKPDVKGASAGFLWVIVIIVLFNLLTLWIGSYGGLTTEPFVGFISAINFLFILVLATNLVLIILLFFLNLIKNLFIHRR